MLICQKKTVAFPVQILEDPEKIKRGKKIIYYEATRYG